MFLCVRVSFVSLLFLRLPILHFQQLLVQMSRQNQLPTPNVTPPAARSDTDEDERDISMQMDGSMDENERESSRDTENPTQHRSVYDEAMVKLSQHVAATQQPSTSIPLPPSDNLANKETVDKPPDDSANKDSVH